MEENKELIYTGERSEMLPPLIEEAQDVPTVSERAPMPRRRGGWFTGLTVGVALFAAAFLLCDGAHALQLQLSAEGSDTEGSAVGNGVGGWLSQLLSQSFAGENTGSVIPIVTDRLPGTGEGGDTTAPEKNGNGDPAAEQEKPMTEGTDVGAETAPAKDPAAQATKPSLTAEQLYAFSADSVPEGMIPIVPMDLSLRAYSESFHYNDTDYTLSLTDLPAGGGTIPAMADAGEVSVLILHTHATEGYSDEGAAYYDPATPLARADDPAAGVVAVGEVIADILNQNGIVTLHSTVLHDKESYKDSYSRAAQTIQSYLAQYPSIRLVIDVHRDSIMTSGDRLVRPVALVDGEATAQVMCVVGSNAAGADYGDWQENLSLAVRLRNALNEDYGNLCRPVYIKKSTYNQQYAPASLLLEVGSSGNSLAEAQRAAALVAEKIAEMMK